VIDFLEGNCASVEWIEEDKQLFADWLNIGPKWKFLSKRWEDRSAGQLKNRMYSMFRHWVQGHLNDYETLAEKDRKNWNYLSLFSASANVNHSTGQLRAK
jgi:hypothetical protein